MKRRTSSDSRMWKGVGILWPASCSWLVSAAAGFALIIARQNLLPPPDDPAMVARFDALTLTGVVTATSMMVIRFSRGSLTHMKALAIGLYWVFLSILGEGAFRFFIDGRHAMRFLMLMIMGDSDPTGGWVWPFVLSLQLCALSVMHFLEEDLLHRPMLPRHEPTLPAGRHRWRTPSRVHRHLDSPPKSR